MKICPKCGQPGWLGVLRTKAKGKTYYYLIMYHRAKRKCVLRRLTEEEYREFKRKKEEARALSSVKVNSVMRIGREELEALLKYYLHKRDYTTEHKELARKV